MTDYVIVSDFDETLSEPGAVLPDEVCDGLISLKGEGIVIVVASGRPLSFLLDKTECFKPDALIAENGNILFTRDGGERVFKDGSEITSVFREFNNPDFEIKETIVEAPGEYRRLVEETIKERGIDARIDENIDRIIIMPDDVHKGHAVREALKLFNGGKRVVVGFGDGQNDLEIFRQSDVKVAVANAVESLKKEADHVTSSPYGYGVLEFARKHLD